MTTLRRIGPAILAGRGRERESPYNPRRLRAPFLPDPLRHALGALRSEVRLALASAGGRRRFRALAGRTGLRLHLGCGGELKAGWVNVDLDGRPLRKAIRRAPEGTLFIAWDLRRGTVPLPDGCCDVVYSSHF